MATDLSKLVGKKIKQVALVKDGRDDSLRIGFDSGDILTIQDDGQSCCESRYLTADGDDLSVWQGAEFVGIELRDGPRVEDDSVHEQVFLVLKTNQGEQVFAAHNEHNGYYGGFSMVAEIEEA